MKRFLRWTWCEEAPQQRPHKHNCKEWRTLTPPLKRAAYIGHAYYSLVNMCGRFTFFTICAQNTKGNPKAAKSQQRVDEQANAQNVHPLYLVRDVREQDNRSSNSSLIDKRNGIFINKNHPNRVSKAILNYPEGQGNNEWTRVWWKNFESQSIQVGGPVCPAVTMFQPWNGATLQDLLCMAAVCKVLSILCLDGAQVSSYT